MENERLQTTTAWFYVEDAAGVATPPSFQHFASDLSLI
jgi:hypothetical protein